MGGTGVVTLAQLLGWAAHMEGKGVAVLDQIGLAQKYGGSSALGMSHFGFWAEDLEQTRRQLREAGGQYIDNRDHARNTTGFFEEKWLGPDGTVVDITDKGWVGARPPDKD